MNDEKIASKAIIMKRGVVLGVPLKERLFEYPHPCFVKNRFFLSAASFMMYFTSVFRRRLQRRRLRTDARRIHRQLAVLERHLGLFEAERPGRFCFLRLESKRKTFLVSIRDI